MTLIHHADVLAPLKNVYEWISFCIFDFSMHYQMAIILPPIISFWSFRPIKWFEKHFLYLDITIEYVEIIFFILE